jgi:PIN domain nuclease of toxin-antitoxin system
LPSRRGWASSSSENPARRTSRTLWPERGSSCWTDITLAHAAAVETLPQHHKDPFDRLLIAQARIEDIPIVSVDVAFDPYGVTRIW